MTIIAIGLDQINANQQQYRAGEITEAGLTAIVKR